MRCLDCGHNNPNHLNQCQVCGMILQSQSRSQGSGFPMRAGSQEASFAPGPGAVPQSNLQAIPVPASPVSPVRNPSAPSAHQQGASRVRTSQHRADVTGRVIAMEGPFLESPDVDACRVLTKMLLLLLVVAAPLIMLHAILTTLGAFSAILAVVGLLLLARFFSPTNLFTLYHLAVLANPFGRGNGNEQAPVRYLRIRDLENEAEHVVRMKGTLTMGNMMPDDLVSFWGHRRSGVLHARYAYSHRTQAWVELQKSYSWLALTAMTCIVLLLIGYFYQPVAQLFMRVQELGMLQ